MKKMGFTFIFLFIGLSISSYYLHNVAFKKEESKLELKTLTVKLEDKSTKVILNNTDTSKELVKTLPITGKMTNLNNNEFYIELKSTLKTDDKKISLKKGDVVIYNSNTLVILYEDVENNYKYTKVGQIMNTKVLDDLKEEKEIKVEIK